MSCITINNQCGLFLGQPDRSEPIRICCEAGCRCAVAAALVSQCVCAQACLRVCIYLCARAFTSLSRLRPLLTDSLRVFNSFTLTLSSSRGITPQTQKKLSSKHSVLHATMDTTSGHGSFSSKHRRVNADEFFLTGSCWVLWYFFQLNGLEVWSFLAHIWPPLLYTGTADALALSARWNHSTSFHMSVEMFCYCLNNVCWECDLLLFKCSFSL